MSVIQSLLLSHAYTLYLFTKSDILGIIGLTMTVAMVLAGPTDWWSFLMALVWVEFHLLAFEIKNQIIGVEEDKLCKPYRPFPSGRISLERGQSLYLAVVSLGIAFSVYHGLTTVSLVHMLAMWLYNENGLSAEPLLKSPLGAVGSVCYAWGATYIIGHHQPMSSASVMTIVANGLIFAMTGHAQDFRDRSGDAQIGRRTIPIILPQGIARWSLMFLIMAFTCGLILFWRPPAIAAVVLAMFGLVTSVKFILNYSEEEDRKSYRLYELWLLCAHILPIFERMRSEISPLSLDLGLSRSLFYA